MFATEAASGLITEPPILEAYNYSYEEDSNKVTLIRPAGVVSGERQIALCCTANLVTWQPVTDWTLELSSSNKRASIAVYSRVSTGTDPTTVDFTHNEVKKRNAGWYLRVSESVVDAVGVVAYIDGTGSITALEPTAGTGLFICLGLNREAPGGIAFGTGPYIQTDNRVDDFAALFGVHISASADQEITATSNSQMTGVQFRLK